MRFKKWYDKIMLSEKVIPKTVVVKTWMSKYCSRNCPYLEEHCKDLDVSVCLLFNHCLDSESSEYEYNQSMYIRCPKCMEEG